MTSAVNDAAAGHSLSIPNFAAGRAQCRRSVPAHPAQREGDADHRPRLPGNRAQRWRANWSALGLPYHAFVLEDLAPRPLTDMPARDPRRHGNQRGQHLRGEGAGQRTAHAHADDRRGQPPQDAPRPHGQYRPPDHAGRHARRFRRGGPHQHAGLADGQHGARDPRHQSGRHRHRRPIFAAPEVAEDQRHHQPEQVGQPARRRNVHHARRGQRHLRDRWRGGRLPLREVRRSAARLR